MDTIGFQSRGKNNEKLVEKPIKMHPDVYDRFGEAYSEAEGFTMANLVNEALAHFVNAGDLSRSIELAEEQLESRGVTLPPHSRSEVTQKNNSVLDGEKSFNQVYDVTSYKEWKYLDKDDTTIFPNTNVDMWEALKKYPGRVGYVAQVAIVVWLDNPFDGMFNNLVSLQQMQAVAEGEEVSEEEATEWVERRMLGIRKESDGDYHEEWEALFSEDGSATFDISEVSVDDEVEIEEEEAREAWKHRELTQNGKNPVGVLRAVLRSKSAGVWDRESVEEIAENVFFDASEQSKEKYVNKVLDEVDIGVEYEWDLPDTSEFKALQDIGMKESYKSEGDMMDDLIHNFGLALEEGATGTTTAKMDCAKIFAARLIEETEFEWWNAEREDKLVQEITEHQEEHQTTNGMTTRIRQAIEKQTMIEW